MKVLSLSLQRAPDGLAWELRDTGTGKTSAGSTVAADALPFPDASLDEAEARHVLQYLSEPHALMRELHRVLKGGATLTLSVPHSSSAHAAWGDPQARREFVLQTFYWYERCEEAHFELDWVRLNFASRRPRPAVGPGGIPVHEPSGVLRRLLGGPLESFANRGPAAVYRAERYWGRLLGFEELEVSLRAVKPDPDAL